MVGALDRYIERQVEHHGTRSFVGELRELLMRHGAKYDPRYLV